MEKYIYLEVLNVYSSGSLDETQRNPALFMHRVDIGLRQETPNPTYANEFRSLDDVWLELHQTRE